MSRFFAAIVSAICLTLSSGVSAETISFVHLTDPHIFDKPEPKTRRGNLAALDWAVDQTNVRWAANPYAFVAVTGDFGLEGLLTEAQLQAAAEELAPHIARSRASRWLLVPGNNDLIREDPGTIGKFHTFVTALRKLCQKPEIVDFCPLPDIPSSAVLPIGQCRFIGFNNACFKSNNLSAQEGEEKGAAELESAQLKNLEELEERLAGAGTDFRHAFVFYHIPNADDPFLASLDPKHTKITKRGELAKAHSASAWLVTDTVWKRWEAIASKPELSGLFAGHFHWNLRPAYESQPLAGAVPAGLRKLYVAPPLADKNQTTQEDTARGFREYVVDCASGEVKRSEFVWYEPQLTLSSASGEKVTTTRGGEAGTTKEIKTAGKPGSMSDASRTALAVLVLAFCLLIFGWAIFLLTFRPGHPWLARPLGRIFVAAAAVAGAAGTAVAAWSLGDVGWSMQSSPSSPLPFLGLMLLAIGLVAAVWYGVSRRQRRPDSTSQATVTVALVFFTAAVLGFAVLASLAWSQRPDGNSAETAARVVSVGALWALASIAVGAAVGFLFGIPRNTATATVRPNAGPALEVAEQTPQAAKTNLEEIADWLSKLLVGGTLFSSNRLLQHLDAAGKNFAGTITGRAAEGNDAGLWGGVGSACLVYFGTVGLFGGYFLTRLYLIGALRRADEGDRTVVKELSGLTAAQIAALDAAPLAIDEREPEFDPIAREAADEIIKVPLESLFNSRDIRLWAKAQLGKGDADLAIKAYQKAIESVPHDPETRLGYAAALSKKNSARKLIMSQLEEARRSLMLSSSGDLRKNVYKSLTYLWLYRKAPESFVNVLKYAREYFNGPDSIDSGGLWVNIACAYGQAYAWLQSDPSRTVRIEELTLRQGPSGELLSPAHRDRLLDWIRQQALAAMKAAISRDSTWKTRFRQLLDPAADHDVDNDLASFAEDADFQAIAGEPAPPSTL